MKKAFFILTISMATIFAGCSKSCTVECIDESKIDPGKVCPMVLAPVCGCNNITYDNACIAESNGVMRYTEGACNEN